MRFRCFTVFSIHFVLYLYIELIILLFIFAVISFARYKQYIIWRVSFIKFSDVWPVCTCASAIGNLWSICLGIIILRRVFKSKGRPFPFCCLLKLRIYSTMSITLSWFSYLWTSFINMTWYFNIFNFMGI